MAPAARGHGVGSALEAAARHQARAWGAVGIVLDHAALSPLSSTFWHRRGYRPLLTTWTRPRPTDQTSPSSGASSRRRTFPVAVRGSAPIGW
ncbi:hypothetical protein GCM10027425_20160 [Alteromonas gracilis]